MTTPNRAISRVAFVPTSRDAPARRDDTIVIVLDPGWTPPDDARPDMVSARVLLGRVVERIDLFDEALRKIDDWADACDLADRLTVDGVTWWFRLRETMWRWLHERLAWANALPDLGVDRPGFTFIVPSDEEAIADVGQAMGASLVRTGPDPSPTMPTVSGGGPPRGRPAAVRWFAALDRRLRVGPRRRTAPTDPASRDVVLADRIEALAGAARERVLILTTPVTYQRVGASGGSRQDPILRPVMSRLEAMGIDVALLGMGLDHRRDADWPGIEADDRLLPFSLLATRWSAREDVGRAETAAATASQAMADVADTGPRTGDVELGPGAAHLLRSLVEQRIRSDVQQLARVERLLTEIRPIAIVLTQEGIRLPWLVGGRSAGIPVFAIQHGVLYPGHAGYANRRHPALRLADRTFVYGEYERRVLVDQLAYEPDEVVVSGSPRLDLDASVGESPDGERRAIRAQLGVRDGDRLLVIATVHIRFIQRSHLGHMLECLLGGPLPRIHLAFKLHPGERDDGFYRELVAGLAQAGGYAPPPVSIVKDVDLYALLRAADAHLGLHSTVLTDAVAAGTVNLIATVDAHIDLLGYVEAGVAHPVVDVTSLRAAIDAPRAMDPERRAAFLADHFRPGDASERIVRSIIGTVRAVDIAAEEKAP